MCRLILSALLGVVLSGCAASPSVPEVLARLEPGDAVVVEMRGGEHYEFKVTGVSAQSIEGDDLEIPVEDIESLAVGPEVEQEPHVLLQVLGAALFLLVTVPWWWLA